jgi:pimeloyl-ACP methyl ester carboxylesterase
VGPAQGHAVLDMARAARNLDGAGISENSPIGLMGYSQGGGAATWAAELSSSYAPELDITAAVLGGVPADLMATAQFLDGSLALAFALMAAMGLDSAYPELNLESYLNERGEELSQTAHDVCLVSVDGVKTLINTAFRNIDDYTHTNPLEDPAWQARLAEQVPTGANIDFPVFQYHGIVDEIVPYRQARQFRRAMCNNGTTVTWTSLPGEHVLGMVEGFPLAVAYMQARFAGIPTWGNCLLP